MGTLEAMDTRRKPVMVNLTIDGRPVVARQGQTVLDAARTQRIPDRKSVV